jgi:ParB family chromosome partitioning protein
VELTAIEINHDCWIDREFVSRPVVRRGQRGERQRALARQVVRRALTVRQTEALVRQELEGSGRARQSAPKKDADTRRLEQDLSERLGAQVTIVPGRQGRGRLQISYNSLDELEGILEHIR